MALSVLSLVSLTGRYADPFSEQLWMRTVETLLPIIRARPDSTTITVSPAQALKFQGDLYGLLQVSGVPEQHLWTVMRLNGYNNPVEYNGDQQIFVIPNYSFIDEQMRLYKTLYRKNT